MRFSEVAGSRQRQSSDYKTEASWVHGCQNFPVCSHLVGCSLIQNNRKDK